MKINTALPLTLILIYTILISGCSSNTILESANIPPTESPQLIDIEANQNKTEHERIIYEAQSIVIEEMLTNQRRIRPGKR